MCAYILVGESRPHTSEGVLLHRSPHEAVLGDGDDGHEVSALPGARRLSLLHERGRRKKAPVFLQSDALLLLTRGHGKITVDINSEFDR